MDDCNDLLNRIANYMKQAEGRTHYLMFVDSEGVEVEWESLSKVLYYLGDLVFVFQTREVMEQKARWKNEEALKRFYGNENWRVAKKEEDLVELYKEQIRAVKIAGRRRREAIDNLTVKSDEDPSSYYYDVIFAAPETKSKNPWFRSLLLYLKERVTKYTGRTIQIALEILAGKSTQIDWFLPKKYPTLDKFIRETKGKGR